MALYIVVILCAMFVPIKHSHGIRSSHCNGAYVCRHQGASNWTKFIDKNQLCDGRPQCPCGDDEEMCPATTTTAAAATTTATTKTKSTTKSATAATTTAATYKCTYCNGAYLCRHQGASNWTMYIDKNQLCDGIPQCPCGDDEEMCPATTTTAAAAKTTATTKTKSTTKSATAATTTAATDKSIKVVDSCRLNFSYNSSFTNVALGKTVTMSSVYDIQSSGWLLVDDNRNGRYPCAHTVEEINPYMMVDLEDNYNVHSLFVLNRLDCCSERLLNLKIELGETPDTMRTYVYLYDGADLDECTVVLDKVTKARYVRLSVVGQTYFTLCEVAVYSLG